MPYKEYDPNKHWYYEYFVGKNYGLGRGLTGQIGNNEYWQKKQQQQQERQWTFSPSLPSGERSWSRLFAILGFFVGINVTHSRVAPDSFVLLVVGAISAYIAGRYYKQILTLGVIVAIGWAISQNSATGEKPQPWQFVRDDSKPPSRPDPCRINGRDIECTTSLLSSDFPGDILRKAEQGYTVALGFRPETVKPYRSREQQLPACDVALAVKETLAGDVDLELLRRGKDKETINWRQHKEDKRALILHDPAETTIRLRSHNGQPATLNVWCRG